ncbi:MAG: DUF4440 domain-containing protein [Acidobacteriota bacterium]|nr:DUF4440 domain-containing protein [Acidobacteriota bacterium]
MKVGLVKSGVEASALAGFAACMLAVACEPPELEEREPAFDPQTVAAAVLDVLDTQVEAWNDGDIEGFMAGYLRSEELRFTSGNEVRRGWRQTLERYRQTYPDRAAMGTLAFDQLDVRVLSEHAAQVFGRFRLTRESDEPTGLFTLLVERHGERWLIVTDHTSS